MMTFNGDWNKECGGEDEVERILAVRNPGDGSREYCIQWHGYALSESTWEPESSLTNCREALRRFRVESVARGHQCDLTAAPTHDSNPDRCVTVEIHCDHGTPGPVQVLANGERLYRAERVLAMRFAHETDGSLRVDCLVKWYGWPVEQSTWEPDSALVDSRDAIFQYLTCM